MHMDAKRWDFATGFLAGLFQRLIAIRSGCLHGSKKRQRRKQGKSAGGSLKLIYALNAIATTLQESIQSEENVYEVFHNQVVALGLRGGISLLDEERADLAFQIRGTFQFTEEKSSSL